MKTNLIGRKVLYKNEFHEIVAIRAGNCPSMVIVNLNEGNFVTKVDFFELTMAIPFYHITMKWTKKSDAVSCLKKIMDMDFKAALAEVENNPDGIVVRTRASEAEAVQIVNSATNVEFVVKYVK